MKKLFTLAFCLAGLMTVNQTMAATVYKWVDESGVTHFSEHPPKNTETTLIKPKTGHSEPVNYDDKGKALSEEASKAAAESKEAAEKLAEAMKDPERCASARKNLETLQNNARVKVKGEDGEYRFLTQDEMQDRLKTTQDAVRESCP